MTVRTVTGYITKFDHQKGFGFAETHDIDGGPTSIFFRIEGAREVETNMGTFIVRDEPDREARPRFNRRNPVHLVMQVRQTNRGWRADKWGHRPGPNWVHSFISSGSMSQFHGGTFRREVLGTGGTSVLQCYFAGKIADIVIAPYGIVIESPDYDPPLRFSLEETRYQTVANGVAEISTEVGVDGHMSVLTLRMPGY